MYRDKKSKIETVEKYSTIIVGGGIYASGIAGLSFLKKYIKKRKEKRNVVFCAGASPYEETAFAQIVEHNMKDALTDIPCFYCRGAWDMDSMNMIDRNLCKLLQKSVMKKNPGDYEVWEKALMAAGNQKCDWTDKSYITPILEAIR